MTTQPGETSLKSSDCVVEFRQVNKTFSGETFVVRDLDLQVRRGEFLTFLGPSGSGKTTTLLLLAGFEMPTSGDILIEGRSVTRIPPNLRNIGMVFQNYALFPHMTVQDNVAFPLSVRGVTKAKSYEQAERVLDLVRLGSLGKRKPQQLSGGQQQRAALARALVFDPSIVLMDEPFGALDKKLREQMQMEVRQIHERLGNTMISVTHDQSEALTMSDRIAVFNNGELQQVATPRELYERPRNAFVAKFVGEINTLDGSIEAIEGDECAVRLDCGHRVIATTSADSLQGQQVVVSVRPERMIVNPVPGTCENQFTGSVRDVT
jgi:putative spermidine/putrescine transport system ATP-binding protein